MPRKIGKRRLGILNFALCSYYLLIEYVGRLNSPALLIKYLVCQKDLAGEMSARQIRKVTIDPTSPFTFLEL